MNATKNQIIGRLFNVNNTGGDSSVFNCEKYH